MGNHTQTVSAALTDALKAAPWLKPADAASVSIAVRLAATLDELEDVREIGLISKQLNDVLGTLGMNVYGRTGKAEAPNEEVNPLDEIRRRAESRISTTTVANSRRKSTK